MACYDGYPWVAAACDGHQNFRSMRMMTAFQAFLLRMMNISGLNQGVWCCTGFLMNRKKNYGRHSAFRCRSKSNRLKSSVPKRQFDNLGASISPCKRRLKSPRSTDETIKRPDAVDEQGTDAAAEDTTFGTTQEMLNRSQVRLPWTHYNRRVESTHLQAWNPGSIRYISIWESSTTAGTLQFLLQPLCSCGWWFDFIGWGGSATETKGN